jgi:hypothetical protein
VGWLSRTGALALPGELAADLTGTATPAQALTDLTSGHADVRGFVAAEPVLRELLATFGVSPNDEAFARWMDALVDEASRCGALELLAVEPARPGTGEDSSPTPRRSSCDGWFTPSSTTPSRSAWPRSRHERELTR